MVTPHRHVDRALTELLGAAPVPVGLELPVVPQAPVVADPEELEATIGTANFRFFVREFLSVVQPGDALGHSLIAPFLEFLSGRDELRSLDHVQQSIVEARASAYGPSRS